MPTTALQSPPPPPAVDFGDGVSKPVQFGIIPLTVPIWPPPPPPLKLPPTEECKRRSKHREPPPKPSPPQLVSGVDVEGCDAMELYLPPLPMNGSCGESYFLEVIATQPSATALVLEDAYPPIVRLTRLNPSVAYRARIATNSLSGRGAASDLTPPLLTDAFHASLVDPPVVRATSSASYDVSWWRSHAPRCRPRTLTYRVQVHAQCAAPTASAAGSMDGWDTVAVGLTRPMVTLADMKACGDGCAFRYRADGLVGWDSYSKASDCVRTIAPPPLALDAIRLLFRVDAALYPQEERALASAQTFRADFAAALALPAGAVELREARGGGVLLLDVTPSPNSSSSAELVRIRQLVLRGARRSARPSMAIIELHRLVPWHPGLVSVASADEIMGARNALLHVLLRIVVAMVGVAAFMGGGYWWYSIHELGVGVRTYASVDGDEISTALTAEGEAPRPSTERA